ncbi:MAG: nitrilase-related carbon-nitrogen hydrolase [bacterium]
MRILIDTNILVYAHSLTSPFRSPSQEIINRAFKAEFEGYLSIKAGLRNNKSRKGILDTSKFRRIGTTSLQYRDPRAEDGQAREQETVLSYIAEAGRMEVDILLFQEEYGFAAQDLGAYSDRRRFAPTAPILPPAPAKTYAELAIVLDDPYVCRVREAARKARVNVVLPIIERDGSRVYNSLVPIASSGEILRPYRKMFPVAGYKDLGEMKQACPGEDNRAQMLADVPVSFAICFDVHFDEVFEAARASGAKLVFWSSMWMGGLWLRAHAIRYGFYIVSSTPDGCTFVDMDGTIIAESFTMWPQTVGCNNLIFEDLNFDREVFHCFANGKLNAIRERYGEAVHIRNRPQDSIVVIETLDPGLSIDEIKREFELMPWYDYIQRSREARAQALREWASK